MKISELINVLQEKLKEVGDVEVAFQEEGFGGHADYVITGLYNNTPVSNGWVSDENCDDEERDQLVKKLGLTVDENYYYKTIYLAGEMVDVT